MSREHDIIEQSLEILWKQYEAIKDVKDEMWLHIHRIEKQFRKIELEGEE